MPWTVPPRPPRLARGDVHVWDIDLARTPDDLARLERLLPRSELRRAARQPFEARRRDLVVSGAALRSILSAYLDADPREARFRVAPSGKPLLDPTWSPAPLRFNLTHSRGRALVAVTRDREVGVDVERLRRDLPMDRLAARFFSPREIAALRATPAAVRPAAFFACWTRKEAWVKACGTGLFGGRPLQSFAVSVEPGAGPVSFEVPGDEHESARWVLESLDAGPVWAAALAVEGPFRVHTFRWDG